MSNATTHPLIGDRRAHLTAIYPDGSRSLFVAIDFAEGLTDNEAEELAHELNVLGSRFRRMQLVSVIRDLNKVLAHEEDPAHSSLTAAEQDALRAAGSLVEPEHALRTEERPSVRTALRQQEILANALTAQEVATLLGVTDGRVRQRNGDRTLFAVHAADRGRRSRPVFPKFQFTDRGELPGWATVSRALPEHANPVAVEHFLTHTHPDLGGGEITPAQWLAAGRPAEPVAALAEQTFSIR